MIRRCVALAFCVILALGHLTAAGAQSATLDQAVSALTRYYNGRIYDRAECRRSEHQGHIFVLCGSVPRDSRAPGGLFVLQNGGDGVSISPLNGRAQSDVARRPALPADGGVSVPLAPVDRRLAPLVGPVLDQFF